VAVIESVFEVIEDFGFGDEQADEPPRRFEFDLVGDDGVPLGVRCEVVLVNPMFERAFDLFLDELMRAVEGDDFVDDMLDLSPPLNFEFDAAAGFDDFRRADEIESNFRRTDLRNIRRAGEEVEQLLRTAGERQAGFKLRHGREFTER